MKYDVSIDVSSIVNINETIVANSKEEAVEKLKNLYLCGCYDDKIEKGLLDEHNQSYELFDFQ